LRHPTNAGVTATAKSKTAASRKLTRELTYEPRNYQRAVVTFLRAHSISQAGRESAVIVSRDQESELMSSLKAPCKKPFCYFLTSLFAPLARKEILLDAKKLRVRSQVTFGDVKALEIAH